MSGYFLGSLLGPLSCWYPYVWTWEWLSVISFWGTATLNSVYVTLLKITLLELWIFHVHSRVSAALSSWGRTGNRLELQSILEGSSLMTPSCWEEGRSKAEAGLINLIELTRSRALYHHHAAPPQHTWGPVSASVMQAGPRTGLLFPFSPSPGLLHYLLRFGLVADSSKTHGGARQNTVLCVVSSTWYHNRKMLRRAEIKPSLVIHELGHWQLWWRQKIW